MDIRVEFPPGTRVFALDGKPLDLKGLKVQPFFATSRGTAVALTTSVETAQGKLVDQTMLLAPGATGRLRLFRQGIQSAVPAIDQVAAKPPLTKPKPPEERPSAPPDKHS